MKNINELYNKIYDAFEGYAYGFYSLKDTDIPDKAYKEVAETIVKEEGQFALLNIISAIKVYVEIEGSVKTRTIRGQVIKLEKAIEIFSDVAVKSAF